MVDIAENNRGQSLSLHREPVAINSHPLNQPPIQPKHPIITHISAALTTIKANKKNKENDKNIIDSRTYSNNRYFLNNLYIS